MGPKPFSSNSSDVSFDKVFAVPVAPGSQENLHHISTATATGSVDSNEADSSFLTPSNNAMVHNKPDLIVEIEIKSNMNKFMHS